MFAIRLDCSVIIKIHRTSLAASSQNSSHSAKFPKRELSDQSEHRTVEKMTNTANSSNSLKKNSSKFTAQVSPHTNSDDFGSNDPVTTDADFSSVSGIMSHSYDSSKKVCNK